LPRFCGSGEPCNTPSSSWAVADGIDPAARKDPMTSTVPSPVAQIEEFAAALRRSVVRVLRSQGGHTAFEIDDIAQDTVMRFLEDPHRVMEAYPAAWVYARASLRSRSSDFARRERTQRGEGARLVQRRGEWTPRRIMISLDQGGRDRDGRPVDLQIADHRENVERVLDRIQVDELLRLLTVRERAILLGVDGFDHSVVEIADALGLRRETVSRLLARIRATVRQVIVAADAALDAAEANA
jgi:RNA polymerase sigma factor (sigma-70 family)